MSKIADIASGKIAVHIWADILCPWCYIGKRRFDRALGRLQNPDAIAVHYHSFQLDPLLPRTAGETLAERTMRDLRLPSIEAARAAHASVAALAAEEGLDYRLGDARMVSSFDAHRLLHFAADAGLGDAMRERLYAAYTMEGAVISDFDTLARLAEEIGLDPGKARAFLESGDHAETVIADQQLALRAGVRGVPTFIIDGRKTGTLPVEDFVEVLERAVERRGRGD